MRSFWGPRLHCLPYRNPWRKLRFKGIPIPDRISVRLISSGLVYQSVDHPFDDGLIPELRQLQIEHGFDAVIVHYIFFSKALLAFPKNVLKIIDTHDIYTDRHHLLRKAGIVPEWFFTVRSEERRGLLRANRVIAIQKNEERFFCNLTENKVQVHTVGHFIKPVADFEIHPDSHCRVMYFGSNNTLNIDSLKFFLAEVWPLVDTANAELHVFGGVCKAFEQQAGNVFFRGSVAKLEGAYREASIVVNPIQTGTGLKIKSIEAMAYGKSLVTTTCGADGLSTSGGTHLIVTDQPQEMALWIKRLLIEKDLNRNTGLEAVAFAHSYYQTQVTNLMHLMDRN